MKTKIKLNTPIIYLVLIMFLCGGALRAQQDLQQGSPHVPNTKQVLNMVAEISEKLSLSTEVEVQITDLYINHFTTVRDKIKIGRPKRKEMEALRIKFEKQVKTLLSKKQKRLYIKLQKKITQKQGRHRPPIR